MLLAIVQNWMDRTTCRCDWAISDWIAQHTLYWRVYSTIHIKGLFTRWKQTTVFAKFSQCFWITKWASCERTVMFYISYIPCEIFANIEKCCRRSRPTTKSYASGIFCMELASTLLVWNDPLFFGRHPVRKRSYCTCVKTHRVWLTACTALYKSGRDDNARVNVRNIGPSRSIYIFWCISTMFIRFHSCFSYYRSSIWYQYTQFWHVNVSPFTELWFHFFPLEQPWSARQHRLICVR